MYLLGDLYSPNGAIFLLELLQMMQSEQEPNVAIKAALSQVTVSHMTVHMLKQTTNVFFYYEFL